MKNNINIIVTIPKDTRHLPIIGRVCEKVAQEINCAEELHKTLSNNLAIVLTEGLVNAIKYGSNGQLDNEIHFCINVTGNKMVIRIYDKGIGFDLNSIRPPNFTKSRLEDKGRGIYILRSLMDEVKYHKENDWNVLEMTKNLAKSDSIYL
jgi:serine/threonine-protein kinase RsbW